MAKRLCLQEKTLPQALRQAEDVTALFGKWHLNGIRGPGMPVLGDDRNHPGHYGFEHWLAVTNVSCVAVYAYYRQCDRGGAETA